MRTKFNALAENVYGVRCTASPAHGVRNVLKKYAHRVYVNQGFVLTAIQNMVPRRKHVIVGDAGGVRSQERLDPGV